MKFSAAFVVFLLLNVLNMINSSYSLCCPTYTVTEIVARKNIKAIASMLKYSNIEDREFCGDGREHDGDFCATQSCNIFGCNCDGHCFGDWDSDFAHLNK